MLRRQKRRRRAVTLRSLACVKTILKMYTLDTDSSAVTHAKHLPEVRISKPEGDVGHMESLGLGLAVRALR